MSEAATTVEGDGIEKRGTSVPADGTASATQVSAPSQPPPQTKVAAATEYLILSKTTNSWAEQTTVHASSAKAAVRGWLAGSTDPDGTYVAVPARSWQPVIVKTETQTKIILT